MAFLPQSGWLLKMDKNSSDISDVVTETDGIYVCTCNLSIQEARGRGIYKDWEVEAISKCQDGGWKDGSLGKTIALQAKQENKLTRGPQFGSQHSES